MTCYWACFKNIHGKIFRFDTRIYIQSIDKPSDKDECIGAVIGMNPGSAKPRDIKNKKIQEIIIGKDKTLPNIKSIFLKAYKKTNLNIMHKYIQVLNLFYLCNEDAEIAIKQMSKYKSEQYICHSEKNKFNFIFYAWGLKNGINDYKKRFLERKDITENYIWFDKNKEKIMTVIPNEYDNVKHPIGLPHEKIILPIKDLLIKYL